MSNKFIAKFVGVAMVLSLAVAGAAPAGAQTVAELQAQIDALLAQLAGLTGGSSSSSTSCYAYTRDLTLGATGADVVELQNALVASGHLVMPAGVSMGYFGALTQSALAKWQAANGISPAAGYFGPVTRGAFAAKCTTTGGTGSTGSNSGSSDLEGGAGSVDSYELMSGLSNEEVGEGEEDVEVAGIEVEVSDGSDIRVTAVKLNFDKGTADEDFEDYASEVSIWLDGEEIARVDADRFDDDNNYQATVSIDEEDAIIRAEETGELTVAVSGINNLDSNDATDTWTVDINSFRFEDAQGATVSEDPTVSAVTFSFETFATAADVELKVSNGDDEVSDARVVNVDASNDTDGVELHSFYLEADGDSDIELKDLPVLFTASGAELDEIANTVSLWIDGEEVATESVPTSATATTLMLFDDVDYTISAGDKVEVIVAADINDLEGTFTEGDTLSVTFGESQTDNESFDAEDEEGNNLADADKTGTSSSGAHVFYDTGIMVELVSISESTTVSDSNDNDAATFVIKYDVTAFDGDVYVSDTATATTADSISATTVASNMVLYRVDKSSVATVADLGSSVVSFTKDGSDVTDSGVTNGVKITEGTTAHFTLTVVRQNSGDADDNGTYRAALKGISWATSDSATQNVYDFDLEDFESDYVTIN